jgi:hypothetical protein
MIHGFSGVAGASSDASNADAMGDSSTRSATRAHD